MAGSCTLDPHTWDPLQGIGTYPLPTSLHYDFEGWAEVTLKLNN